MSYARPARIVTVSLNSIPRFIGHQLKRFILAIRWRHIRAFLKLTISILVLLVISTSSPHLDQLTRIKRMGALRVATTNNPTTCYQGAGGPAGYECTLLVRLAKQLGVQLKLTYYSNAQAVLNAVINHHADIGAAGLVVNDTAAQRAHFTAPLYHVRQQLVYRKGAYRPNSLEDLHGQLEVVSASASAVALTQHLIQHPDLAWETTDNLGSEDLLYQVARGALTYTVASSDLIDINRRYYPSLQAAFDVSGPEPIAWALRQSNDDSLYKAVQGFIRGLGKKRLAALHHQYFNGRDYLNYLGVVRFTSDYKTLLPKYEAMFKTAGKQYGIDWRLLAAIGYQESHWNPDAVSYTGVRGLMMLTDDTSADLHVSNRRDAEQSIDGGARYLKQLLQQLPDSIKQPDRTWMALAAYNMGIAHLYDARTLAQQLGKNPDKWTDVRQMLPLLMQERWFSKTRYGYADGGQAKAYVANIRSYYDILVWITSGQSNLARNATPPTPRS